MPPQGRMTPDWRRRQLQSPSPEAPNSTGCGRSGGRGVVRKRITAGEASREAKEERESEGETQRETEMQRETETQRYRDRDRDRIQMETEKEEV